MWSRTLQKTSLKNSIAFKMFEAIESQLFDSTKSIHEKTICVLLLIACGGFLKPTNLHIFILSVRRLISCKSFDEQFRSISIHFYCVLSIHLWIYGSQSHISFCAHLFDFGFNFMFSLPNINIRQKILQTEKDPNIFRTARLGLISWSRFVTWSIFWHTVQLILYIVLVKDCVRTSERFSLLLILL